MLINDEIQIDEIIVKLKRKGECPIICFLKYANLEELIGSIIYQFYSTETDTTKFPQSSSIFFCND